MIEKIERDGKVLLQITQETEGQNLSAMAEHNEIPGLLSMKHFRIDGKSVFQYDITGLESMKERYCRLEISENGLEEMICQISAIIRNAKEWLLEEPEFFYTPETIYYREKEIFLPWVPGTKQNRNVQMEEVAEYLMKQVNSANRQAAHFIYRLYRSCKLREFQWEAYGKAQKTEERQIYPLKEETIEELREEVPKERSEKLLTEDRSFSNPKSFCGENIIYVLCCMAAIIISVFVFRSNLLKSAVTRKLEWSKVIAFLVILIAILSYMASKLFSWKKAVNNELPSESDTVILRREENPEVICLFPMEKKLQRIFIKEYPFYIGNDKGHVDGVIEKKGVSRVHGWFSAEGSDIYYTDKNSTNGTSQNGKKLIPGEKVKVNIGDILEFGNTVFCIEK